MIDQPSVSVVIPTRNRKESLVRLLACMNQQAYPLDEVIISDSSDGALSEIELNALFPNLTLSVLRCTPSVCIQRNIGIMHASSEFIFVCDDDIEIGEEYVSQLMKCVIAQQAGVVSGLIMQMENGHWTYEYPPKSFVSLLFAFVFQFSVWGDLNKLKVKRIVRPVYHIIRNFYSRRGNQTSLGGWPQVVDFSQKTFQTSFYGLGASIIKREWLINNKYDEILDSHGIGDNYGVALGFPEDRAIHVVTGAKAYHHQSGENRLDSALIHYRRLLALHYFLKEGKAGLITKLWFLWSLIGLLFFHKNKKHRGATLTAFVKILTFANPYVKGKKTGEQCVTPIL